MTRKRDIAGLVQLTQLHFQAAQSEMAAVLAQEARLNENLAQLMESREALAAAPRDAAEPALIAGADLRWNQWVDQRRAVINAELAQCQISKERCRNKLREAFGRSQASAALEARAAKTIEMAAKRRSAYES